MTVVKTKVREITSDSDGCVPESVYSGKQPVVLKRFVSHWPLVKAGLESREKAAEYLSSFYSGRPVTYYYGEPSINGRVFYNADYTGFNFARSEANLNRVLELIDKHAADKLPPTFYVGSTRLDEWLPGFRAENDLRVGAYDPIASVWLGNKSAIAAHYDVPDNIACNVVGKRTFTLFPPEQIGNLYVGPLDITPSGRAVSLVDLQKPDFERFPRFREALAAAQTAHLEPGDALFIPSMWWHHVQAEMPLNVLVNFWWRATPPYLGNPENVLHQAILEMRSLPDDQKAIWKNIFEHYIFGDSGVAADHIPQNIRGILAPMDELVAQKIRSYLLKNLKR